jgi:hypothetical protein
VAGAAPIAGGAGKAGRGGAAAFAEEEVGIVPRGRGH